MKKHKRYGTGLEPYLSDIEYVKKYIKEYDERNN